MRAEPPIPDWFGGGPPARSAAALGQRAHPDGHGIWKEGGRQVGFWLEYDTGTETHARLQGKIDHHRRLHLDRAAAYPLLFWLPTEPAKPPSTAA